jgi:hypothetical protein
MQATSTMNLQIVVRSRCWSRITVALGLILVALVTATVAESAVVRTGPTLLDGGRAKGNWPVNWRTSPCSISQTLGR